MTDSHKYYDKYKRDKESQKFYRSNEWRKVRELALKRDNYLCQRCLKEKKLKKADLVHHILELRDYPELRSELSNLESICHRHHNQHHKVGNEDGEVIKVKANVIHVSKNKEIII